MKNWVVVVALVLVSQTAFSEEKEKPANLAGVAAGAAVEVSLSSNNAGSVDGGPAILAHRSYTGAQHEKGVLGIGFRANGEISAYGHPVIPLPQDQKLFDPAHIGGHFEASASFLPGFVPLAGCGLVGELSARAEGHGSSFQTPAGLIGGEVGLGLGCLRKDLTVLAAPTLSYGLGTDGKLAPGSRILVATGPLSTEASLRITQEDSTVIRQAGLAVRAQVGNAPKKKVIEGVFIGVDARYTDTIDKDDSLTTAPAPTGRPSAIVGQAVAGFAF